MKPIEHVTNCNLKLVQPVVLVRDNQDLQGFALGVKMEKLRDRAGEADEDWFENLVSDLIWFEKHDVGDIPDSSDFVVSEVLVEDAWVFDFLEFNELFFLDNFVSSTHVEFAVVFCALFWEEDAFK